MKYVEVIDCKVIIRLKDRLNYNTGVKILNELKPFAELDIKRVDVYCGELVHISSAGIKALVHTKRETGVDVILHNVSKSIKDVLIISLADTHFVFEDEEQSPEPRD
jgi:anti-anti-sigma regulatory factor